MKQAFLLGMLLLLCASKASAQLQVPSFASDPATCNPNLGVQYYNTTSQIMKYCSALNTWSAIGPPNPNAPGIPATSGNIFYASNYGVKGGGIKYCDATWANSSSTVTINNTTGYADTQFTPSMTGWIVYGTNADCNNFNIQTGTTTQVPLGTLTVASTGNTATISTTTTGACTSNAGGALCSLMIFPQDDGPNLQIAWNAAIAACANGQSTNLILPATNFYSGQFIPGPSSGQCGGGNDGDGGIRLLGVQCVSTTGCVLFPSPGLDWSTVAANNGGFFSNPTFTTQNIGFRMRDFTIDCSGTVPTNGGNGTNKTPIFVGGNTVIDNVSILRCQTNFGLWTNGSDGLGVYLNHIQLRGDGSSTGVALNAGVATYLTNSQIVWSEGGLAQFTCTNSYGECVSIGNQYELGSNGTTGILLVTANANNYFTTISDHIDAANNNNQPFLECASSAGGLVKVIGSDFTNPVANGNPAIQIDSGCTLQASAARLALTSLTGIGVKNAGSFYDLGGNVNTSLTQWSGAGAWYGAGSQTSNSVAVTAAKLVLSATWGSTAAWTALSGGDAPIQGTITNSGTGQGASPTITYTFPNPYPIAPYSCTATQTGGTNATGTFTTSALSATGATFTFSLTPGAASTEIVNITCLLP